MAHRLLVALVTLSSGLASGVIWFAPPLSASLPGSTATAAVGGPTLSVDTRLDERRFVAAGTRAYEVGTEAGRYPAMGFHTRGEMGGIWAPPLKLLDGLWFAVDGRWLERATRFTSGYGYVSMRLPETAGLAITRTDVVPDGRRALLVRLDLRAQSARSVTLTVDAHSELMSAYPWGETLPSQAGFNLPDTVGFDRDRLVFREVGTPIPHARRHDWAALVGASLSPTGHAEGADFRGPQDPAVRCPVSGPGTPRPPSRYDDTAYGRGAGGQLRYRVSVPAGQTRRVWVAVAGSDQGLGAARTEYQAALADPDHALAAKVAARTALANRSRLFLPGDPLLQQGIEWGKQNLADSVQEATALQPRATASGTAYPEPVGRIPHARFVAAGFPDYPWLFGTDGEYTAFALTAVGQFDVAKDHLRALRDVSLAVNGANGKVVHEVVSDGAVYFGATSDPGNTDETAKFPSVVALLWRWTGDRRFLDEMYGFAVSNLHYVVDRLDADGDGWPEGLGNVERPGMGQEKLDNAVYTIRGLRDLESLAIAKHDRPTAAWAGNRVARMERAFDRVWWMPAVHQHADSLRDPGDVQVQQRHWIGVTPMEVELAHGGRLVLGLASVQRGRAALELRESRCYGTASGLFHTGAPGCDPAVSSVPAERKVFTLNSAVMAVGEGNYGRLGSDQQRRFTTANRQLQLPEPDEQPGAMPEIAPSPDYGRSVDLSFLERAMVLQAWGQYGTVWPVVHQQLGVRPDVGNGRLEVTPQLPPGSPGIAGSNIQLGDGSLDVSAVARAGTYVTAVRTSASVQLTLGVTLSPGARVSSVTLDGARVPYLRRATNRGQEVVVGAGPAGAGSRVHTLVVRAR